MALPPQYAVLIDTCALVAHITRQIEAYVRASWTDVNPDSGTYRPLTLVRDVSHDKRSPNRL